MKITSQKYLIMNQIYKELFNEGYSIPDINANEQACAIINQMTKCKKINSFQMEAIKQILNQSTKRGKL